MTRYSIARLIPLILVGAFAIGCGGGGSHTNAASRGALQLNVTWPATTRSAGAEAASMVVSVLVNGHQADQKTVNRPNAATQTTTQTTFTGLPAGELSVAVAAFSGADGTGDSLGTGNDSVVLSAGETDYEDVTMPTDNAGLTVAKSATGSIGVSVH